MKFHKHLPENTEGIDYIIGDLHGCKKTFDFALKLIGFNPEKDRMFSVGDLVDRGRESEECANLIHEPWFHVVRGNHEQMAIDYQEYPMYDGSIYMYNGGAWFIDLSPSMQKEYATMFDRLPIAITIGNNKYGIVHAEVPCDDWNKFVEILTDGGEHLPSVIQSAMWRRDKIKYADDSLIKNIDTVFCGHTPVKQPVTLGNVRYIDTGCVFEKSLTVATLDGTLTYNIPLWKD